MISSAVSARRGLWLKALTLVLVALNLRPPLTSLGPVLPEVIRDTGMNAVQASLLTTLPVLCMGLFAPLAPILARKLGAERVVMAMLAILGVGTLLRGVPSVPALFAGAVVAGAAIGVVNVVLPGLVKRDFADRTATMMGVYTMALAVGAAAASAVSVPLEQATGSWSWSLNCWVVLAVLAFGLLAPQTLSHAPRDLGHDERPMSFGLWRSRLAWQVSMFMGLQSAMTYVIFGWLAPMLRDRGLPPVQAGLVASLATLVQIFSSLGAPALATRGRDQRAVAVASVLLLVAGFLGCLMAPLSQVWGFAFVMGIGQGAVFAVALTLIVLRAPDAMMAGQLSSMAQSIGYTMAAFGPLLMGALRQWTGDWLVGGVLMVALAIAAILAALGAGRARLVPLAR